MSRQLPSQPNLRHLKNEAKEFRKALGRGDAGIAERLAANLPRLSDATSDQIQAAEVSLQEVQHVLAKEYGFTNWTELAASAEPPALPAGLEAVGRPLEQLSNDSVRQICHGISRIVKAYGESVASIGPGDFYRELEAVGGRASANISEVLNLAADGIEPAKIRHLMHNRTDNVMRNLEIRLRVVLEGVTAIRSQEHPRLIGHRLDTVCYSGYAIQYRGPEGTVEHFRDRMAERPAFHLRNDELAMAIVDLAWIAQQAGVAALQEVVDVIDDEHFRVGVQLVVDQVDAAELEGRIAPALERVRVPFTLLGEGLAAALEPRSVTACQPSRPAVGGHVRRHLRVPGRRDPRDDAIRVLDTRDGVPQRNSQAIWEDTDGSIWIAAGRSLVRQEGAGFRAVEIPTSSPVLDLDVAPDGALWLGTQDRGVLRIDEDGSTTKYTTQSGLRSNQTTVLHVDPEGDVWVGIAYEGLARIRASGEVEAIGAVPGSLVYDIQPDRRGGLWFATDAGITRYDPWVPYQFVSEYRTYFQQHYGRDFFVGTFGDGLYHLHDGQVEHYTSQDGLSGNDIVVMHVGRDSVLWIGTESGVSRYADGALAPLHTGTRLDTTHVWGLLEGADGRLWLTTPEGLFCYDGLGVRHLTTADGLASDRVSWRLFEDRDGGIWVTYERFGQSAFGTTAVTRLSAGEARSYSIPRRPLAILQDRQGTVWLGTDAGLFRHTAWGLEPVVLPGGTRANSIRGIIEGSGSLWLATNAGLTHYDGSTSRRYTVRDGLTSDVMSGNPTRDRRRQHLVADLDRRHGHRRRGLPALHHTRWTPR